ncbi:MAG: PEGA domain-containing protein [Methanoregula sp.]|jgi:hypothetical protein
MTNPVTEKGTLYLTSSPQGAEVYLDNQYQGSTPVTIPNVEPGNHTLEYRSSGYMSWSAMITVTPGTSQIFAALAPGTAGQQSSGDGTISPQATTSSTAASSVVTVQAGRDVMIIGNSQIFSGSCNGCSGVNLVLFGPGYYTNGVQLAQVKPDQIGSWSYTWNPGSSVLSGSYTLVATDTQKTSTDRAQFAVIGGGIVTVASSSYSASSGNVLTFSGQCTTGAPSVHLVLSGPDRFSNGADLGSVSVMADKTWKFKYTIDTTMPAGIYTMTAYDVPRTTSGTAQFTVGFNS